MNNISPIGNNRPSAPSARVARNAKSMISDKGNTPNEVSNGERNARATDVAAAKRQSAPAPTTNQDGRGGNLDIVS